MSFSVINSSYSRSTLRNAQQTRLLCFPAELRNAVYAYVLTESPHAEYHFNNYSRDGCCGVLPDAYKRPHRLALLATCRQIHTETKVLPFSLNVFSFYEVHIFETICTRLLLKQRSAMTHIVITDFDFVSVPLFLDHMAYLSHIELRSILPNACSLALYSSYMPYITEPAMNWEQSIANQSEEKQALIAWLEGSNGQVKVEDSGTRF